MAVQLQRVSMGHKSFASTNQALLRSAQLVRRSVNHAAQVLQRKGAITHALDPKTQIQAGAGSADKDGNSSAPVPTPATLATSDFEANLLAPRPYYFNKNELVTIQGLRDSMTNCATAFTVVAITNIMLSLYQGYEREGAGPLEVMFGVTIGDVAYWGDSLLIVLLLNFASASFDKVLTSRNNQMPRLFQGLNRLGLIFQQLSIGSFAVSTVTVLEAAVKYPKIVVFSSTVFFFVAMSRAAAMWWVLSKHTQDNDEVVRTLGVVRGDTDATKDMPLLDRWAVWLAFGYLLQFELSKPELQAVQCLSPRSSLMGSLASVEFDEHYEFSAAEERILRSMTESANTAGLMLAVQAFATFVLTTAEFGLEDWSGVVSNGINFTNKAITATLIFGACQSFDRALHTVGKDDVDHVMDGLGEHGLTETFNNLSTLAWAISLATAVSLLAPWLEESPVFTALSDAASHRSAETVVEVMEWLARVLKGI